MGQWRAKFRSARPKNLVVSMLWRADTKKTQYSFVGKVGQGIYQQGSDKTHRPDDNRMRGLGTWRHTEGVPHACTARGGRGGGGGGGA